MAIPILMSSLLTLIQKPQKKLLRSVCWQAVCHPSEQGLRGLEFMSLMRNRLESRIILIMNSNWMRKISGSITNSRHIIISRMNWLTHLSWEVFKKNSKLIQHTEKSMPMNWMEEKMETSRPIAQLMTIKLSLVLVWTINWLWQCKSSKFWNLFKVHGEAMVIWFNDCLCYLHFNDNIIIKFQQKLFFPFYAMENNINCTHYKNSCHDLKPIYNKQKLNIRARTFIKNSDWSSNNPFDHR